MSTFLSLPAHLSHESALILLPPSTITAPIQSIRSVHDRNYKRWPPHIKLIYPFLSKPSTQIHTLRARIREAFNGCGAFDVELRGEEYFGNGQKNCSVHLAPDGRDFDGAAIAGSDRSFSGRTRIEGLQRSLQEAFAECDADNRAFEAYLTLGQARGHDAAKDLEKEAVRVMEDFCRSQDVGTEAENQKNENSTWGLHWLVDRVVVVERGGFQDPFEVVAEVLFEKSI